MSRLTRTRRRRRRRRVDVSRLHRQRSAHINKNRFLRRRRRTASRHQKRPPPRFRPNGKQCERFFRIEGYSGARRRFPRNFICSGFPPPAAEATTGAAAAHTHRHTRVVYTVHSAHRMGLCLLRPSVRR